MKKYLLFDLDGTLTDPKVGICTCVQYALASFGIEEPDLDKLEPFIGPPLKDSFMEFYHMSAEQAEEAIEKYRERFRDTGIFENKLYDGIPEMLRALNSKGMFLAVASSKPTEFVRRILEHFKIAKYFSVIVGSEMDGTRTGKDEVVQEALRRLFGDKPVEKNQVYMIGDRRFDVEGAHAMGVEAVGVTYGYGSMEELKEAKADYIVRSVEELRKFLLRGTEEPDKITPSQRVLQVAIPAIMFFLVRGIAVNLTGVFLTIIGSNMQGGDFLFVRNGAGELENLTGNAGALISMAGYIAAAVSILSIAKRVLARAADSRKLMHIRGESAKSYVLLGTAAVGLALGINLLMGLSGAIEGSASYQEVAQSQYSASLLMGLLSYGVFAPIAEELLFRGIIYNCFRRYMKLFGAMIVSAALFGAYHGNSVQGIYAFILGCFMVYAYEYFGDFWIPVAIHIAANVLVYVLSYTNASAILLNWPVCVVCLVCGAGSVWMLNKEKSIF